MIYLALCSEKNVSEKEHKLRKVVEKYAKDELFCISKRNLSLICGKLYSNQDMDQVWESNSAVLIGRTFDKGNYKPVSPEEFSSLSQKLKKDLPQKIWGKYVYWWLDANKLSVMVDPTGQLPCFYYALPGGDIIFSSHIELIQQYISHSMEYNWDYLCSYLFYGNSSSRQTAFNGVKEVPPGCVLTISDNDLTINTFWNPFSIHEEISPISNNDAVSVLQSVLKPVINPYQNICVSLSGGVDSSSLVYCLSELLGNNQKLTAVNYFHSEIESSNELCYARRVCKEIGIELTEVDFSQVLPFDPCNINQGLKFNKPFPGIIGEAVTNEILHFLPSEGSCLFLSGHGSDHIFMRPPTQKSISDYLLSQGVNGLKDKINEIAHFYRDSLAPILAQNMKSFIGYLIAKKIKKRMSQDLKYKFPPWLNEKTIQYKTREFMHPAYCNIPSRILPGKYHQIDALYEGLASVHVSKNDCYPEQYPFFYEPVVNFALSFPTYDLFKNGYDRYPLRHAISSHFKTDTIWRRDKGQTTGILQLGVKKNIDFVIELCLEGEMVKQGFVDKEGLRQTILNISNGDNNYFWPFIRISSIEMFLRMWSQK